MRNSVNNLDLAVVTSTDVCGDPARTASTKGTPCSNCSTPCHDFSTCDECYGMGEESIIALVRKPAGTPAIEKPTICLPEVEVAGAGFGSTPVDERKDEDERPISSPETPVPHPRSPQPATESPRPASDGEAGSAAGSDEDAAMGSRDAADASISRLSTDPADAAQSVPLPPSPTPHDQQTDPELQGSSESTEALEE